jgi:hypothetical protein
VEVFVRCAHLKFLKNLSNLLFLNKIKGLIF